MLLLLAGCAKRDKPIKALGISDLPPVMLWAWEVPEDLTFLDTTRAGVAFLAEEILIRDDQLFVRRRQQPLHLRTGTKTIPVIRIETNGDPIVLANGEVDKGAPLDSTTCSEAARSIVMIVHAFRSQNVQIDYDARVSERTWYRQLLDRLRSDLPKNTHISITALASWCIEGKWVDSLTVDEAVPMLFRMGVAQGEVTDFLRSGKSFRSSRAEGVVGISTDEAPRILPAHERVYIFNPKPWTELEYNAVMMKYGKAN